MKMTLSRTLLAAAILLGAVSCSREPLHLHHERRVNMNLMLTGTDINTMWTYEAGYDLEREWLYGWDTEDNSLFGPMGYADMDEFQIRRYFLGDDPNAKHTSVRRDVMKGTTFRSTYQFGFYDMLAWNDIRYNDFSQAIIIRESLDSVVAHTGETKVVVPSYPGTRASRAFNQPEALFSGYVRGVEVTDNREDYTWSEEEQCYVKKVQFDLQPVTYIYLVQFVLHHNEGKVSLIQGDSNLSAMSSGVCLNTGVTLDDAVTVNYKTRLKKGVKDKKTGEVVDVIGGKLTTFGLCGMNPTKVNTKADLPEDRNRHYVDLNVTFYNGLDSTMVFDVTDKIRERYRGGVITIDIDMSKVKVPSRAGGSGFDAVVKEPTEEEFEIII